MSILISTVMALLLLSGCSRDYAPDSQANAEQIYQAACTECHKTNANGSIFTLKKVNASIERITAKVHEGSWLMPSFPNFSRDDLSKISNFVLEHSDTAGE